MKVPRNPGVKILPFRNQNTPVPREKSWMKNSHKCTILHTRCRQPDLVVGLVTLDDHSLTTVKCYLLIVELFEFLLAEKKLV